MLCRLWEIVEGGGKNKGAMVESYSAHPSAESWPSHGHHSLLQGFAAPRSKADSAGGGLSHLQLHRGGGM